MTHTFLVPCCTSATAPVSHQRVTLAKRKRVQSYAKLEGSGGGIAGRSAVADTEAADGCHDLFMQATCARQDPQHCHACMGSRARTEDVTQKPPLKMQHSFLSIAWGAACATQACGAASWPARLARTCCVQNWRAHVTSVIFEEFEKQGPPNDAEPGQSSAPQHPLVPAGTVATSASSHSEQAGGAHLGRSSQPWARQIRTGSHLARTCCRAADA